MSPSSLASPNASSPASIVGTAPTPVRSAGDGSTPAESFARALNQANGPSVPAPGASRTREQASTNPLEFDSRTLPPGNPTHHATAYRPTLQRKEAAESGDEKSPAQRAGVARGAGASGNGNAGKTTAGTATDTGSDTGTDTATGSGVAGPDPSLPNIGGPVITWLSGRPAAADRAAGKTTGRGVAGGDTAGASALASTSSRGGLAPGVDTAATASAAAAALGQRGETGASALAAAADRASIDGTAPAAMTPAAPGAAAAMAAALPTPLTPLTPSAMLAATANGATATPSPTEGHLPVSPGSSDFAPALGAQLTVFLRDGVQQARLHLHPAELGPLTVQIQLDGASAQVRLAAEHPLTRQALEQAMPTLASTLRESGLTLTGGGVFEQPANQQQPDARAPGGSRADGARSTAADNPGHDAADAAAAPLRTLGARRGVVDLVA